MTFKVKPRPLVEVTAGINYKWQPLGLTTPRKFLAKDAGRVMQSMAAEQNRLLAEMARVAPNDNRKRNELKKKLEPIQEKIRKFTLLNELCARLREQPAKLNFSVFSVIDEDHRVPLLTSLPPEEPEAADAATPEE